MQKQAPSLGRILIAAGFTLSCFGLILFLWIAFGGPTPLKSKSYRVTAYFPEATQLAVESDVRIGGVSVGKVKGVGLAPEDQRVEGYDTTEAVIEIEPQFAPISSDARAILRQKTLLGETYVELTSGTEPGDEAAPVALGASGNATDAEADAVEAIEEGGELAVSQTRNATQIDEIFNALDDETRTAFQRWQQNVAGAIRGRGLDVNDALGNLGPFVTDASEILAALNRQKVALKGVVRDTGTVFAALSSRDQELAGAIVGSEQTFGALADSDEALAESFRILPTFQRETRATLTALDDFQANTRPLVQRLLPVANDISPTLRSVRQLSPNLEDLFRDLGPLIRAGEKGIPALGRFLGPEGLRPMLNALAPILGNLAPAVSYLREYRKTITDFLAVPGFGLSNTLPEQGEQGTDGGQDTARTYLKQLGYLSAETLSIWGTRLPTNRGNAYPAPDYLSNSQAASTGIFGNFDCKNTDYTPDPTGLMDQPEDETPVGYLEPAASSGASSGQSNTFAACFIQDPPSFFGGGRAPNLLAAP
jgi:ABC-type transporter Mla subunit MlaD